MYKLYTIMNVRLLSGNAVQMRRYAKNIKFGDDARSNMFKGIEQLTKAVAGTLGPKGRNVVIESHNSSPIITKDGATVAENIILPNRVENLGVKLIQNVSKITNEKVGDGTTTSTILAHAIIKGGFNRITKGVNSIEVRQGILKSVEVIDRELTEMAIQMSSPEEITQIASLSANNDSNIGHIISTAIHGVNQTGAITITSSKTSRDSVEIVPGIRFDRGFISPYFVNSDNSGSICNLQNAFVLISQTKISSLSSIITILESIHSQNSSLLIITDEIDTDVLSGLILNKLRLGLQICIVKSPSFGENRSEILKDIAISTGATIFSDQVEQNQLDSATIDKLGRTKEVTVTRDETVIICRSDKDLQKSIDKRVEELQELIESTKSISERDRLRERLGQINGGVAVIAVGGSSELEIAERQQRFHGAVRATRVAIEHGIVPGGGIALLRCAPVLELLDLPGDQRIGVAVVRDALYAPCYTIAVNAGVNADVVIDRLMNTDGNMGYDALAGEYVDMIDSGIIDPVTVVRAALSDAAGIASLLLTVEAVVTERVDDEELNADGHDICD